MHRTVCTNGVVQQGKGKDAGVFQGGGQQIIPRVTCLHRGVVLPRQTAFFTDHLTAQQTVVCQKNCNNGCGAAVA